jgi:hypothetical protein
MPGNELRLTKLSFGDGCPPHVKHVARRELL